MKKWKRPLAPWAIAAVVLVTAAPARSQTLVANWVADDVATGTVFTYDGNGIANVYWTDRVDGWQAGAEPGSNPPASPYVGAGKTIGSNNRAAVSFNDPDTGGGGLNIDRGESDPIRNPVVGLSAWSATVVFQTSSASAGGGGNTDPGGWWQNGALMGIELGGGDRGDWAIWMTDGNATGGAKLGASRGDPDGGTFYNTPVNDGVPHVVTATYELDPSLNHVINLYLDGNLVDTQSTFSGGLNDQVENTNLRIGSHNNFGFFKGRIGGVQLHDGALSSSQVSALYSQLDSYYGLGGSTGGPVGGDYNGDGFVDAADYTVWRDNEGAIGAPGIPGDGDDGSGLGVPDGFVTSADYNFWQAKYGSGTPPSAVTEGVSVPEPSGLFLLGWAAFALAAGRSRS